MLQKPQKRPTVLSGAMYKDIWYLPQGNSWAAQFIEDANGDYLWRESEGTGSLSLKSGSCTGKRSEGRCIGSDRDNLPVLKQMKDAHSVYSEFDAFKNGKIYSFTEKKGSTGGVLYYELAPNRPDIVLKDIVKILHPELLPKHELYFFSHCRMMQLGPTYRAYYGVLIILLLLAFLLNLSLGSVGYPSMKYFPY